MVEFSFSCLRVLLLTFPLLALSVLQFLTYMYAKERDATKDRDSIREGESRDHDHQLYSIWMLAKISSSRIDAVREEED